MSDPRQVIEGLLRLAAADVARIGRARRRNAVLYVAAALAGLTAYAVAVVALVLWVARHADPVLAALVVAAGFAALALVVLAVVAVLNRQERAWRDERLAFYRGAGATLARAVLGKRLSLIVAAAMLAGAVLGRPRTHGKGADTPAGAGEGSGR
ncbi:MAG: hypothetical protein JJT95_12090 [Pararhodobacter sp.]|nr:hypothetical protein [Pararhodobacter sp.]